ncbi:MAG: glutathione S-transferase [Deltaproteobacteria bacterium]|nr:glutathione S-transferase [Deltaproteobacteria bacterium]MBT4639599.1 glutathione S-transferase [Deltaproteobacteria bacterium]MBT6502619.1 glutathione S-transferase [Deltaproteobacteria bacterium]MBT7153319.1 glutathione S-transferase [Deltaproteobacteria bacterium]MBT7715625.1 glutathione S-transferase [Deltaproteobacteria bacterium]
MENKQELDWVVWGSELSPFLLKVIAMCRFKNFSFRHLPVEGTFRENWHYEFRRQRLIKGKLPLTWPEMTELDEFPAVPFIFGPNGENLYDSTAIAYWLDRQAPLNSDIPDLVPEIDRVLKFIISLIDEYADEYGLYMVHHYRWKVAAGDNTAGERFACENSSAIGPLWRLLKIFIKNRQTVRMPYLFSVAPEGFHTAPKSKTFFQPPSRKGFPPTYDLLEESYLNLLAALEPVLEGRPYLFGDRFTLADASIYGQLDMNMTDPSVAEIIEKHAPTTWQWLKRIQSGDFSESLPQGKLVVDGTIMPLLAEICRVFVPLMQQNYQAYLNYQEQGETLFNEKAFWQNRSLYKGQLDGTPFQTVVKSFQVRTWLDLRKQWDGLESAEKEQIEQLLPANHGLDHDLYA